MTTPNPFKTIKIAQEDTWSDGFEAGKKEGRAEALKDVEKMIDEDYPDIKDENSGENNRENFIEWKDKIIKKLKELEKTK